MLSEGSSPHLCLSNIPDSSLGLDLPICIMSMLDGFSTTPHPHPNVLELEVSMNGVQLLLFHLFKKQKLLFRKCS